MAAADPRSTRARARALRRAELVALGVVTVALLVWLVSGGPWYLFVMVGVLGVALLVNVVAHLGRRGPEDVALWPGQLREAQATREAVSAPATWAPTRRAPERSRHEGRLQWLDGRLSFVVTAPPPRSARLPGLATATAGPDLTGTSLLDAELWELRLGPPPSTWRPQLVLVAGSRTHVLDLAPGWDLTVGVSALVAREWWGQLHDLGVPTADAP